MSRAMADPMRVCGTLALSTLVITVSKRELKRSSGT
jgi:hypothetical protein